MNQETKTIGHIAQLLNIERFNIKYVEVLEPTYNSERRLEEVLSKIVNDSFFEGNKKKVFGLGEAKTGSSNLIYISGETNYNSGETIEYDKNERGPNWTRMTLNDIAIHAHSFGGIGITDSKNPRNFDKRILFPYEDFAGIQYNNMINISSQRHLDEPYTLKINFVDKLNNSSTELVVSAKSDIYVVEFEDKPILEALKVVRPFVS